MTIPTFEEFAAYFKEVKHAVGYVEAFLCGRPSDGSDSAWEFMMEHYSELSPDDLQKIIMESLIEYVENGESQKFPEKIQQVLLVVIGEMRHPRFLEYLKLRVSIHVKKEKK